MSGVEPTLRRPTRDYPRTPDGKYKYTTSDGRPLHFEPYTIPELIGPNFLIPAFVTTFFHKLFRRKQSTATR
jgi:hypothetical protein